MQPPCGASEGVLALASWHETAQDSKARDHRCRVNMGLINKERYQISTITL